MSETLRGNNTFLSLSFSPNSRTLATVGGDKNVKLWSLDRADLNSNLDKMLLQGCNWVRDYLKHNPNVSPSDRIESDRI